MPVVTEKDREVLGELADMYREAMIDNPRDDVYQNAYVKVITALALSELAHTAHSIDATLDMIDDTLRYLSVREF